MLAGCMQATGLFLMQVGLIALWPWSVCATRQGPRRGRLKGPQRQEEWLLGRGAGAAAGSYGSHRACWGKVWP